VGVKEGENMTDALAVDLEDAELYEEIEVMAALMIAARGADRPLPQAAVDQILSDPEGLTPR
jgi:hypothetical protein